MSPRPNPLALPLYLLATAASLFGNAAITIVLPWLVLERTGDASLAGTVAAISAVPAAIAALGGGVLIDRVGRRRIAVLADLGSALSVAALAVVDRVTGLDLTWFIVLGVAGALFDVPGMTARDTLVSDVARASGRSVDVIASWRQGIFGLTWLLGPALAGVLLARMPAIEVVWVTAACSALAALLMALTPLAGGAPAGETHDADGNPLSAWGIVRRSRPLVMLMGLSLMSSMLVPPLLAIILPAHFQGLGRAEQLGLAMSAFAVGSVVGSGVYAMLLKGHRFVGWCLSLLLFGLSFALIATLGSFWVVAAGMALAGIGEGVQGPIITVALTRNVPERLRGRVFGLMGALSMIASPVGLAAAAWLLHHRSLGWVAWALAVAWVPVAVAAALEPSLRRWISTGGEEGAEARGAGGGGDRPDGHPSSGAAL